jgi:hypothetical protein
MVNGSLSLDSGHSTFNVHLFTQPGGITMSNGTEGKVYYFHEKGSANTDRTLEIAFDSCKACDIKKIVVATSTGETALKLHKKTGNAMEIIAVTYGAGSRFTKEVERFKEKEETIANKGIKIVRGLLTFSGVERGLQNKYKSGLIPLNIIADTLRMFSQGVKVCVEVAVMAAEHGFITPDEDVVVVAGSGHGADTALILRPAYAANLFETKIKALLCMPA